MRKFSGTFIVSSAVILTIVGAAKLVSSFGTARILNVPDAVFHVSFRHIFQIAAMAEFGVAGYCFFGKNRVLQAGLLALLSSNFLMYRMGLYWEGYHGFCHCLGNLSEALHIPPDIADGIMKFILAYLLVGSYSILFWLWNRRTRTVQPALAADEMA